MLVSCRDVMYSIGSANIINRVNASFKSQGLHTILGPNGSGKSTLLSIIAGLVSDYSGCIEFSGFDAKSMHVRDIAMHRTMCLQNLAAPRGVSGATFFHLVVGQTLQQCEATDLFRTFDPMQALAVDSLLHQDCGVLSGGEFQRLYVASAMTRVMLMQLFTEKREHLFLLDEPISNLDPPYQVRMLHVLQQFALKLNCTTVAVVHDVNLALRWSSNATLMKNGAIVKSGSNQEVLAPEILTQAFGATFKPATVDTPFLECDPHCELLNVSIQHI